MSPGPIELVHRAIDDWAYRQDLPSVLPSYSLIFVYDRRDDKLLLGLKKRGFGVDLYNGFGGKPELGEDMRQCAKRELEEECGVQVADDDLEAVGEMTIARPPPDGSSTFSALRIYVYVARHWSGQPIETEEMSPRWVALDRGSPSMGLPLSDMWPEAGLFIPPIIASLYEDKLIRFEAYFEYRMLAPVEVAPWQRITKRSVEGTDKTEVLAAWEIHLR